MELTSALLQTHVSLDQGREPIYILMGCINCGISQVGQKNLRFSQDKTDI